MRVSGHCIPAPPSERLTKVWRPDGTPRMKFLCRWRSVTTVNSFLSTPSHNNPLEQLVYLPVVYIPCARAPNYDAIDAANKTGGSSKLCPAS